MATSLLLSCGLNEQQLNPFIHISEESGVDGTFLISSIIGQRLRIQNNGVILICLQHTYQHYQNAGMRLGYNLNMSKDKNLRVIEIIKDIAVDFTKSCWLTTKSNNDSSITEHLLNLIRKNIDEILTTKQSVTILIDNIGILINFGSSEKSILKLCQNIVNQLIQNNTGTVITKLNNCEIYEVLNNNLKSISDLELNVIKLKSGNFKEVDGRLMISKEILQDNLYDIVRNEKNILYKINDRNIKIFNPGEVGIKL